MKRMPRASARAALAGSTFGCVAGSGRLASVSFLRSTELRLRGFDDEPHGIRRDTDVHEVEAVGDGALDAGPLVVEVVAAEHSADAHAWPPERNVLLHALVVVQSV